jgi:hypothetical protein
MGLQRIQIRVRLLAKIDACPCEFGRSGDFSPQIPLPGPVCLRRQIVDAAVEVAVDEPGEHVGQVDVGLDGIEFTGLDQ